MQHPPADRQIDADQLRAELTAADPRLPVDELELVAHGWDNEMWRLSDDLAVRVARRTSALELLTIESVWLPRMPSIDPVLAPVPVLSGPADPDGRVPWIVVPWIEGTDLRHHTPAALPIADDLGVTLARLHQPAPTDAPRNPVRGVPLGDRADRVVQNVTDLGHPDLAEPIGRRATTLAPMVGPERWLHGDVHPGNMLANAGLDRLVGLIDFGDLGRGDVASDLAGAWVLFDEPGRSRFRSAYETHRPEARTDVDLWRRAEWWAVSFTTAVFAIAPQGPLGERCRVVWDELRPLVARW